MSIRHFFLALCFVLCFCGSSEALMFIGSTGHCPTCTTGGVIVCEGFENSGTGPVCTVCGDPPCWTINDGGDGSVTFEAHPADISTCTDEGSYAMKIANTGAAAQYAEYNINGDTNVIYIQGWFYVSAESLADEGKFVIIEGDSDQASNQAFRIYIEQEDTPEVHLVLSVQYWETAGGFGGDNEGTTTITMDAWHRIIVGYDADDFLKVWLDENADASPEIDIDAATIGGATYEVSYVYFGSHLAGEEAHTIWWDNIKVDATAAPGNCQ